MFKPSIRVKYGTHTHTTLSLKAKQTQQTQPPTTTTTQANLTKHDLHIYPGQSGMLSRRRKGEYNFSNIVELYT